MGLAREHDASATFPNPEAALVALGLATVLPLPLCSSSLLPPLVPSPSSLSSPSSEPLPQSSPLPSYPTPPAAGARAGRALGGPAAGGGR